MAMEPLETAESHSYPTVRQHSIFVENRVGQLLRLTQLLDRYEIRILAVSVVQLVDCAVCRMILDDPDLAQQVLTDHGFRVSETELLVVSLPHGRKALLHTWAALLGAEVNVYYTYPLLVRPDGHAAIAVHPDDIDGAIRVFRARKFRVLDHSDLAPGRGGSCM